MLSQFNQAAFATAKTLANQSGNWVTLLHRTLRGLLTTAQHTLMLFGLGSLILIGLIYTKPESLSRLQASITRISQPETVATVVTASASSSIIEATPSTPITRVDTTSNQTRAQPFSHTETKPFGYNTRNNRLTPATITIPGAHNSAALAISDHESAEEQRNVSSWLAKRYRVANDATYALVSMTYQTASEIQFDPLLILAVMAIESGFNPIAESPMGAQGLMQVMSKVHHARFKSHGGIKEALNPAANIKVGSSLLKELVVRGGSVEAGLKSYVGASAFSSENGYGSRVMAEYRRLKQVAQGSKEANPVLPVAQNMPPENSGSKEEVVAL